MTARRLRWHGASRQAALTKRLQLELATWLEGRKLGVPHGSTDGEATRMPADFLIGPNLCVEHTHYASSAAEHLSLDAIERWAREG